MPAKIVLNPYSNRWGAGKAADEVIATLQRLEYDFELVKTTAPGEAINLSRQAVEQGFDPIVAAGGDGAISEVVNGLLGDTDVAPVRLGIIPLGSANDYAVQLGIPLDIEGACQTLVAAENVRTLDAGRCNDRVFQNDITIAFGAQVNIEAATIKRLRGSAIYLGGVAKALKGHKLPVATIEWEDGKLEDKPILLAYVGNGWRTGGVFYLAPDAILDDGFLDFVVGDAMGRLNTLRLLPKTFNGSHVDDSRVFQTRFKHMRITSSDPLPVLSDGEIIYRDAHDLEISVLPGALRVIVGPKEGERPRKPASN